VLIAAVLATVALAPPAEVDRYNPVPPAKLTVAHERMSVTQGGQRVRVTIPMTPGVFNAYGDSLEYRWDTDVDGGPRCRPGALPDLGNVTAGTVIDAALPRPPKSWCRGGYGVELEAVIRFNCANDPPPTCGDPEPWTQRVAYAPFEVGPPRKTICRQRGKVDRCWYEPMYRDPARWIITAPLDDLLGPDGATSDADPYFERGFRGEKKALRDSWETDDNTIYAWASNRADATRMTVVIDRVLRAGPYAQYDRAAEAARS
jgi:hypothetical protein